MDDCGAQVIHAIGAEGLDRRGPAGSCRLFLGHGFRLGARWNRLVEAVKTRKKLEKTGEKWARYGLKRAKEGANQGSTWQRNMTRYAELMLARCAEACIRAVF